MEGIKYPPTEKWLQILLNYSADEDTESWTLVWKLLLPKNVFSSLIFQ